LAKPNYSFEKRQRELAKRRKKEDKLAEKAARKTGGPDGDDGPTPNDAAASLAVKDAAASTSGDADVGAAPTATPAAAQPAAGAA
jgi:hypothetical protein